MNQADIEAIEHEYDERAAIGEYEGGLSREEAEEQARLYIYRTHGVTVRAKAGGG